ncbi:MAG: ParB N-terminal domain-containing protein [Rhodobacteraceae bacterium]|nr:ParB N-terminal domain-containing protein [Paracoccaceae bacterium]
MARRRRIDTPSEGELQALEDGFARETPKDKATGLAPIAQVVAEAARLNDAVPGADRARQARDQADAERFRSATEKGLVVNEISISSILSDEVPRDRLDLQGDEMAELKASILAHGVRLPIEVYALPESSGGSFYGLISGYRRLLAVRMLYVGSNEARFATIPALIRQPDTISDAFVAMVEENEIRSDLSQYERGRIAVIAAGQGVYGDLAEAVDTLFPAASKAKRSKIRSFAEIHLQLGEALEFPTCLNERAGLRLAAALRAGAADDLKAALMHGQPADPHQEWALLEPVISGTENMARDPSRGGRPQKAGNPKTGQTRIRLAKGLEISHETGKAGHAIRFHGGKVDARLIERAVAALRRELAED